MNEWVRHRVALVLAVVALLVPALVVTSGPAQAALVPSAGVIHGSQGTLDPVSGWQDWVCATNLPCAIMQQFGWGQGLLDDLGVSRWVDMNGSGDGGGGSSSGSWGPVPPAGPGTVGGFTVPRFMHPIVVTNDGRDWEILVSDTRSSGTNQNWGYDYVQICQGDGGGGFGTSAGRNYGIVSRGQTVSSTGSCGSFARLVMLHTYPTVFGSVYNLANYETWTNGAARGSLSAAVKYTAIVECWGPNPEDLIFETITVGYEGVEGGFVYPSCKERFPDHRPGRVIVEGQWPGRTDRFPVIERADPGADGVRPLAVRFRNSECQVGSVPCQDWTLNRLTSPGDYKCFWGNEERPIGACSVLELAYMPVAAKITGPNTDGDPTTGNRPGQGGGGGGGSSGGGAGTVEDLPPGSEDDGACFPSGWAMFNPVEWIVKPFKCVLTWAFVPDWDDLQESVTATGDAIKEGSSLGQWFTVAGAWNDAFAASGNAQAAVHSRVAAAGSASMLSALGDPPTVRSVDTGSGGAFCQGPAVSTGVIGDLGGLESVIYPFNACSGVMAQAAWTSHMLLTLAIGWFSGWRMFRIIGAPFGYDMANFVKDR